MWLVARGHGAWADLARAVDSGDALAEGRLVDQLGGAVLQQVVDDAHVALASREVEQRDAPRVAVPATDGRGERSHRDCGRLGAVYSVHESGATHDRSAPCFVCSVRSISRLPSATA